MKRVFYLGLGFVVPFIMSFTIFVGIKRRYMKDEKVKRVY